MSLCRAAFSVSCPCVNEHSAALHSATHRASFSLIKSQPLPVDNCTKPYHDFSFMLIKHAALSSSEDFSIKLLSICFGISQSLGSYLSLLISCLLLSFPLFLVLFSSLIHTQNLLSTSTSRITHPPLKVELVT